MPVIYREDITKVDDTAAKVFENEEAETQNVINSVNDFINNSPSKLEGKAWNKERKRFQVYVKALEKRKEVSKILATAVKNADNHMRTYMDGFEPYMRKLVTACPNLSISLSGVDIIDTAWTGAIQDTLNKASTILEQAQNSKSGISKTKDMSDKEKAAANRKIGEYDAIIEKQIAIVTACQDAINYINKMPTYDKEAYAKYDAAAAAIAELEVLVEDVDNLFVIPTKKKKKYVYVPSGGGTGATGSTGTKVSSETETTNQSGTNAGQNTEQPTVQPVPIANTVTTSNVSSSVTTNNIPADEVEEEGFIDDDYIDDEIVDEGPVIGGKEKPTTGTATEETVVVRTKDNTLRNVGLGIAGVAAAGAVGYGAYKAIKNSQENNTIEDKEEDQKYEDYDYGDDFEIKTNEDDKQ